MIRPRSSGSSLQAHAGAGTGACFSLRNELDAGVLKGRLKGADRPRVRLQWPRLSFQALDRGKGDGSPFGEIFLLPPKQVVRAAYAWRRRRMSRPATGSASR